MRRAAGSLKGSGPQAPPCLSRAASEGRPFPGVRLQSQERAGVAAHEPQKEGPPRSLGPEPLEEGSPRPFPWRVQFQHKVESRGLSPADPRRQGQRGAQGPPPWVTGGGTEVADVQGLNSE